MAVGEHMHTAAVALAGAGADCWHGVLLRGPSGSGKSDLAARAIDAGARLISDDQTLLRNDGGSIVMTAPAALAGLLEMGGLAIVVAPALAACELVLMVDLVAAEQVERLPEPSTVELLGVAVPRLALAPFEASALAKLRLAVA